MPKGIVSPLPERDRFSGFNLPDIRSIAQKFFQGAKQGVQDYFTPEKTTIMFDRPQAVASTPSPKPQSTRRQEIPAGTDVAMNYIKSIQPPGTELNQAFPALADQQFMQQVAQADQLRPGLANLLLLQALFESTLGRNTNNIFGVKPGGQSQGFTTPQEALQYQLGPHVLGGGANPNMNILGEQGPLTLGAIEDLYGSYNPEGDYLKLLLQILGGGNNAES